MTAVDWLLVAGAYYGVVFGMVLAGRDETWQHFFAYGAGTVAVMIWAIGPGAS